jgi:hypothetical protein
LTNLAAGTCRGKGETLADLDLNLPSLDFSIDEEIKGHGLCAEGVRKGIPNGDHG